MNTLEKKSKRINEKQKGDCVDCVCIILNSAAFSVLTCITIVITIERNIADEKLYHW